MEVGGGGAPAVETTAVFIPFVHSSAVTPVGLPPAYVQVYRKMMAKFVPRFYERSKSTLDMGGAIGKDERGEGKSETDSACA